MPYPRLTHKLSLIFSALLAIACTGNTHANPLTEVQSLVDQGSYQQARAQIKKILSRSPAQPLQSKLLFEKERMRRIEMEFTIKREDLLASIHRYIPDASEDDIRQWDREGLLESMVIDGERRFFRKAAYNLVQISDKAAARNPNHTRFTDEAPLYALNPHHLDIMAAATAPRRSFRVDYSVTVEPDAVPAGETVRAWLPFPKTIPGRQEQVTLLQTTPEQYQLAPEQQAQRTIYFEQPARAGKATEFRVSYRFDSIASYTPIDPQRTAQASLPDDVSPFLQERAPHLRFTPQLRALSERIVGDEKNPYRIARKLFAHVDSIPWAGAREYSTIRDISQYAAEAGHADCGQQTLLLITLLRMNGIPARWQSGWEFSPAAFDTMHDWGELYLAPYGWLPMDVTHGLLGSADEKSSWFYLGGIDAYRLIFNTDYSQPFQPAKQHFRSETVDSQRGEVEWRGGNLYFDQWDYHLDWKLLEES
ncbi:transglutaminase-like domain-containing protein [Microbulbifer hainanensis]|uniref:transglutaminase-like domain-containing protein n=1 Tax=Microbulbifer hainanensis TaxID=2735675 RepID=UPI0029BFAAEF|nr:transglutaminase-like domain-containing protein [Microbulbifer hainanensis]